MLQLQVPESLVDFVGESLDVRVPADVGDQLSVGARSH
jgi:hypothetical protein